MMRLRYRTLALGLTTCLASSLAFSAPLSGEWHLNASAAWQDYDSDRNLKDATLFGLGLEYGLGERFSVELGYWRGKSDRERLFLTIDPWELTFQEIRLDGFYHLRGLALGPATPYWVGGLGYSHFENQDGNKVWDDARLHLGPGVSWELTERWRLLADARAAYSPSDERLDFLGRVGLGFNLSGRAASEPEYVPEPQPEPVVEEKPEPVIETLVVEQLVTAEARVNFATMSYRLTGDYAERFAEVVDFMGRFPEARAVVSGHTDNTGPTQLNLRLSEDRARSVANYLVSQGIEVERLELRNYGYALPVATNETEAGRAENRRTEVKARAFEEVEIELGVDPSAD